MAGRTSLVAVRTRRWLIWAVFISFIVCVAWVLNELRLERNKRLAYKALVENNGSIVYDFSGKFNDYRLAREWLRIFLGDRYFSAPESVSIRIDSERDLDQVYALYDLKRIRICCHKIPKKFLARLNRFPQLKDVAIVTPKISVNDFDFLASMKRPDGFRLECSEFEAGSLQPLNRTVCPLWVTCCGSTPTQESLRELAKCEQLRFLSLIDCPIQDSDLQHLYNSTSEVGLLLLRTQSSDQGILKLRKSNPAWTIRIRTDTGKASSFAEFECTIPSMKEMPNTTSLTLYGRDLTDAMLSTLREAKSLTELQLVSCSITDEGFMEVGLVEGLKILRVVDSNITDAGLRVLEENKNLEKMELKLDHANGSGLIDAPPSLKELRVRFNSDYGIGAKELERLHGLELLHFYRVCPRDDFVQALKQMTNLKELAFPDYCIPREEVEELRAALPHCTIRYAHWLEGQ